MSWNDSTKKTFVCVVSAAHLLLMLVFVYFST